MSNDLIKSFEEFKKLNSDEKYFYIYSAVASIGDKLEGFCIENLDKRYDERYAKKIVETIVMGGITLILVAFIGALIGLVIIK